MSVLSFFIPQYFAVIVGISKVVLLCLLIFLVCMNGLTSVPGMASEVGVKVEAAAVLVVLINSSSSGK